MSITPEERVVVVTGANEGIGHQILTSLVDEGYRVAGFDVEGNNVVSVSDDATRLVRFYECDVADSDDVRSAVDDVLAKWGRIDVLVNNAAVATVAPFETQTAAATRREFEVNVFGYLEMIRAVLPHMRDRGGGIIHNVGSPTGDIGHPALSGYAATKGAIKGLTKSLQLELQGTGVSCTLMLPPTTNTRMVADLGYPRWMMASPEAVGRKLARKIDSTDPVITPDRRTALGLYLFERIPRLWRMVTERYVGVQE